jgi:hypothetical protein
MGNVEIAEEHILYPIEEKCSIPDVIQPCPDEEAIKQEEPTDSESVDLLAEVQQLRSAVELLIQAVPISEVARLTIQTAISTEKVALGEGDFY